ncbi:MAG: biopolymer transporter ExbD [Muribaculaceae bacterium]|nr:biopolymer transporter ExbD [Muribaculaceae bacterium]
MALKRQHETLSMFSMASMTDVIFLLLIFFLVTSTFVFPSAMEVNLPQSSQQTAIKPNTRVYIGEDGKIFAQQNTETTQGDLKELTSPEELRGFMLAVKDSDPSQYIALHADEAVPYGKIVEILEMGTQVDIKVVLATKPSSGDYKAPDAAAATDVATEQPDQPAQPAPDATQAPVVNGNTTVTTTPGDANTAPNTSNSQPKTTVTVQ